MFLIKNLYYLIEVFVLFFLNIKNQNYFYIITPRIISLFLKKVIIYNYKKNNFVVQNVRNFYDINTVYQVFGYAEYNLKPLRIWFKIFKDYKARKQNKKIIIDCGSNIGSSTRYFSEIFPDAMIYSIEPDKENFSILKKNILTKNIFMLNTAVASKKYDFTIKKKKDPRAHEISINKKKEGSSIKKKAVTINEIIKKEKKIWPFLIKIDIEGFEKDLFQDNIEWMNKFKVIIIEIHDWMVPSKSISASFIKSLNKTMKIKKRDLIINGENLISVRND